MITQICAKLNNKKILILGYGREGKSTYHFLRKHFPKLVVGIYDKNEIKEELEHVILHTGDSYEDILSDYDMIIKSPGIVFHCKDDKVFDKLTSQTEIFLEFYRDQTIGITGTKGKSTTSTLLNYVLNYAGKDAILAGNIGIPVFDVLEKIKEDTIIVYEMSSHQLEFVTRSPHIALYLNIYQEHLDHYGTFEKYARAKDRIFEFQREGDLLVYNKEFVKPGKEWKADSITISDHLETSDLYVDGNQICYCGEELVIQDDEILLKGHHNIYNIGASYCIAKYYGIDQSKFYEAVKTFQPLPHRLEFVAEIGGVKFYNDSISTICETTIQGVMSLKNIDTVILGGMDRGIDYQPLVDFLLDSSIRNFILMPDTGYRIRDLITGGNKSYEEKHIFVVTNVEEAVKVAKKETGKGMTCLFSPAAASYGFFKNFEERGNVFKSFVLSE